MLNQAHWSHSDRLKFDSREPAVQRIFWAETQSLALEDASQTPVCWMATQQSGSLMTHADLT
jgi:hypothetical protein